MNIPYHEIHAHTPKLNLFLKAIVLITFISVILYVLTKEKRC